MPVSNYAVRPYCTTGTYTVCVFICVFLFAHLQSNAPHLLLHTHLRVHSASQNLALVVLKPIICVPKLSKVMFLAGAMSEVNKNGTC